MRRRPPRFALVLSALVAAAGIAVLLLDNGPSSPSPPPTIGFGATRVCVTAPAQAEVTAQSAIVITATSEAPLTATESASGPKGLATVTRHELLTARFRVSEPVSVRRVARSRASACARADSSTAAHDVAVRKASAQALLAAHKAAAQAAATNLKALLHRLYPGVLRKAQAKAAARARQLARGALPALAAQAAAQARRQAGA